MIKTKEKFCQIIQLFNCNLFQLYYNFIIIIRFSRFGAQNNLRDVF